MKKFFSKTKKGFTLLEALIYTGLVGILLTALMSLVFGIFFEYHRGLGQEEVNYNANFLLNKITYEVRRAKNVILPETTGETLSLEMASSLENPTSFALEGKKVIITRGAGGETPLTSDALEVESLSFTKIDNGNNSLSVRIELRIKPAQGGISKNFITTATLRK